MILGYKKLGYKNLVCCFSQIDFSVKMIVKVDIFFKKWQNSLRK